MGNKFICEGKKFELGSKNLDTIGLPILVSGLPKSVEIDGYELFLKTSFHVSLVCVGKIIEKYKITNDNFLNEVVRDFCDYVKEKDISFLRYKDEFRFVYEGDNRSIVVMCEVSNLSSFFDLINKKYSLNIEYQPTHVTLYTLQTGIFIIDKSDLDNLTKVIKKPIGVNLI